MKDVTINLGDGLAARAPEEQLALLDQEVEDFSRYMAGLEDTRARGALNHPERALVKTYLVAKIRGKI